MTEHQRTSHQYQSDQYRVVKKSDNDHKKTPKRLFNLVSVYFKTSFIIHECDARDLFLRPGDDVIVQTSRGPLIATVKAHIRRAMAYPEDVHQVLRKATIQDLRQAESNQSAERDAYRFALERIRARKLPMKLVRAQYMQDGSKIVFYFSADGRIDFRDLVKDLAHRFRTRIEMHQIGVRDGTRMIGGIGPCGRELCCSTFLEHFAPVSIKMAKDQGLTLNPKKVSGMCGRLMCCLVYEQKVYKNIKRKLPKVGQQIVSELGKGEIVKIDVVSRKATVRLEDTNYKTLRIDDIALADVYAKNTLDDLIDDSDDGLSADYLWDDLIVNLDDKPENNKKASKSKPKNKSSRRRRYKKPQRKSDSENADKKGDKPTKSGSDDAVKAQNKDGQKESKTQDPQKKRRRRRRRSKKPKDSDNSSS